MLVDPSTQQLQALAGLVEHSRWPVVSEYIGAEIAHAVDLMVDQTDTTRLHELRGRIKALKEFQSMAREASKTLEKLRAQPSPL